MHYSCREAIRPLTAYERRVDDRLVSFNLAELFERVADAVPEREAVVTPDVPAHATRSSTPARPGSPTCSPARGVGRGDHVGLQLHNGAEYLEVMLAAVQARRGAR